MKKMLTALIMFSLFMPSTALSCDYAHPGDAVDMIDSAEVVFAGIIEEILHSPTTLIFNKDNKIIDFEPLAIPTMGVTLRVTPVKVYKGYVPEEIRLTVNIFCDQQFWMAETGRIRVVTGNRLTWGDSELEYFEPLGQHDPTQRDFINYLEMGIEPEIECPTLKLPNSTNLLGVKEYSVRCHRPHSNDDPFRFIPPRPAQ